MDRLLSWNVFGTVLCLTNSGVQTHSWIFALLLWGMPIVSPIAFVFAHFYYEWTPESGLYLNCKRKPGNFVTTFYVKGSGKA
jgi:hypothetical protein